MDNINSNDWQQVKQTFKRKYGNEGIKATLGDVNGVIDEPGYPGYVRVRYAQQQGSLSWPTTLPFEATMIKKTGAAVIVGYDDNGDLAVLRPDVAGQRSTGDNTLGNNASDPNVSYYVNQQRLTTLVSHPISSAADSMLVTIQNWLWIENGTVNYFGGGDGDDNPIDLSSYIPVTADEQCIACLFIKTDNTAEVIASTPKSIAVDPDIADIQECLDGRTAGGKPVWAWRLYNGQTGITPGGTLAGGDDFMDLRQFINVADSSTGGSYYQTVEDNGTPLTQRPSLNFIGATVADNPGTNSTDVTVTGGSASHSYVGYNTIGGSVDILKNWEYAMKKITVASAGILLSIEGYLRAGVDGNVLGFTVALYADDAGVPGKVISYHQPLSGANYNYLPNNSYGWIGQPVNRYIGAGDYWIAVVDTDNQQGLRIAYDTGGSDRTMQSGTWLSDGDQYSQTDTTWKYSIRASFLAL